MTESSTSVELTPAADRRAGFPWATALLIAAVSLYSMLIWRHGGFEQSGVAGVDGRPVLWALGAAEPHLVLHGEWWRLISGLAVHLSLWPDVAISLLSLLFLGQALENRLGWQRLLCILVGSGLTGAAIAASQQTITPYGMSPAIAGLAGAALAIQARAWMAREKPEWSLLPLVVVVALGQIVNAMIHPITTAPAIGSAFVAGFVLAILTHQTGRKSTAWAASAALGLIAVAALLTAVDARHYRQILNRSPDLALSVRTAQLLDLLSRKPQFLEARLNVIRLLAMDGHIREMVQHHDAALRQNRRATEFRLRDLARAMVLRAERQAQLGNYEAALERYQAAVLLDPGQPHLLADAHNGLAWTLTEFLDREHERALQHAREANRLHPGDPMILDTLAWTLHKLGRSEEALPVQRKALEIFGLVETINDPADLNYHLGMILAATGRREEALRTFAVILRSQGDHPRALEALRSLTRRRTNLEQQGPALGPDPAIRTGVL